MSRPKRAASSVAKNYRDDSGDASAHSDKGDEVFEAHSEERKTAPKPKKRLPSTQEMEEEDGEMEEEEEEEEAEAKKGPKKKQRSVSKSGSGVRSSSVSDLLKSDKWKISTGERVATASGEMRFNPSMTTVPFLPVHGTRADAEFVKIASWNVNGLRSVLGKSSIARWIVEEDPLIICLQETKTNTKKKDGVPDLAVTAPGYTTYWAHAEKPGYAGVATLTKVAPLSVKLGLGAEKHDSEGRVLTLEFEQFFLVNTYWPNSGDKLAKLQNRQGFNKAFQAFIATLRHKHVVVAGDLNVAPHPVDLHNPKGNKLSAGFTEEERADFHELCREGQLLDTWREMNPVEDLNKSLGTDGIYTYWGFKHNARENNRGWRVDHILITNSLRPHLEKAFIRRELLGSDHTAVGILLSKSVLEAKKD